MKKSSIILLLVVAFILSFLSLLRQVKISENYRRILAETERTSAVFERYVKMNLESPIGIDERLFVDQIGDLKSNLLVIVPNSICDACAISLLYQLKDSGISLEGISLYVDKSYPQIVRIAKNLGIGDVSSLEVPEYVESILLVRHESSLFRTYIMRYQDGFSSILELFLQESEENET